jgi:hypothetical protein
VPTAQHILPPRLNLPHVAQLVFTELGLGAIVLTVNVILLGGEIVFFQSLCLLGYCLFPINIAALVCTLVHLKVSSTGRPTALHSAAALSAQSCIL